MDERFHLSLSAFYFNDHSLSNPRLFPPTVGIRRVVLAGNGQPGLLHNVIGEDQHRLTDIKERILRALNFV